MMIMMKQFLAFLLIVTLSGSCFAACDFTSAGKSDNGIPLHTGQSLHGIMLSDESVNLLVEQCTRNMQLTPEALLTNSTQINVSAEGILDETEIKVYLFLAEETEDCIAEAVLSSAKNSVVFTNLSSAEAYIVGVTAEDKDASVSILITD